MDDAGVGARFPGVALGSLTLANAPPQARKVRGYAPSTDFEKRAIFYKHLIRLLKFGQDRDTVDLLEVVLTHHSRKNRGEQAMKLPGSDYPTRNPLTGAGSGQVREKQKACLTEIIAKLNDLFGGDTTDGD